MIGIVPRFGEELFDRIEGTADSTVSTFVFDFSTSVR